MVTVQGRISDIPERGKSHAYACAAGGPKQPPVEHPPALCGVGAPDSPSLPRASQSGQGTGTDARMPLGLGESGSGALSTEGSGKLYLDAGKGSRAAATYEGSAPEEEETARAEASVADPWAGRRASGLHLWDDRGSRECASRELLRDEPHGTVAGDLEALRRTDRPEASRGTKTQTLPVSGWRGAGGVRASESD